MTKKNILLLVLMLLITGAAFAGGGYENVILYQATNVPNNQGIMIELSQPHAEVASSFSDNISSIYSSTFPSNLPLFCAVDTLNSAEAQNVNNIEMTISSPYMDGFYFVKDGNETQKVPFTLDAFIIEFKHEVTWGIFHSYSVNNKKSFTGEITVGGNKKTSYTESVVAGKKTYTLSMPSTNYSGNYPVNPRYYYICVNIAGANNLEDGQYTATLYLNCARMGLDDQEIQVKGYVGEKPTDVQSGDYSFFVNNGDDTYFSDLEVHKGDTSPSLEVANLQFYYSAQYSTNNTPVDSEREKKYRIYISPTSTYSDNAKYTFIRTGTENQNPVFGNRIYYELDTSATTGLTKYNNNVNNNTYYLITDYSKVKTKEGGIFGGNDVWQETWILEGKSIYIQIAEESKETINPPEGQEPEVHQTGTYYSYMYFTVESTF